MPGVATGRSGRGDMSGMRYIVSARRRARARTPVRAGGVLATLALALLIVLSGPGANGSDVQAATGDRMIPKATAARLGGDARRTRFVLDLTGEVGFSVFVLADPFRVIIDLPQIEFRLPAGLGEVGRGVVSAYRYGLFSPGKSRVVIDTVAPVLIEKSFVLKALGDQPARLVVDLVRTDRANFDRVQRQRQQAVAKLAAELAPQAAARARKSSTPRAKTVLRERSAKSSARPRKPVVVIDPGHGGVDPGAIGRGRTREKHVVLTFSKILYRALKATGRYDVHLTRDHDTFLRLRQRVKFARKKNADLFIAVHADAAPRRSRARGATVYTLSERASDKEAAALAAKENRADLIAGVALDEESDEVTGILIDLAQRETKNHSVYFAKLMVKALKKVTRVTKRPHRFAGFRVLKAPDVPSILLELGYLTSRQDEKLMQTTKWRKDTAGAVVAAVKAYFAARARLWNERLQQKHADAPLMSIPNAGKKPR